MAEITASMVKELRQKTGAGMMDCKKALQECGGDMEQATDELRKRGQAIASKRAGRSANEGLIFARMQDNLGAMVELNCETDFVARNDEFKSFGQHLADLILSHPSARDTESLAALACNEHGKTVEQSITDLIGKIGEKITLGRVVRLEGERDDQTLLTSYIHPPGKLGVMIELKADKPETLASETIQALARDLAMQVAASAPLGVSREDIPREIVDRERAIYQEQVAMQGKPEHIRDKIVEGKLGKFFKESALLEQAYIKDPDRSVSRLIEAVGEDLNDTIQVVRFERFVIGEAPEQDPSTDQPQG